MTHTTVWKAAAKQGSCWLRARQYKMVYRCVINNVAFKSHTSMYTTHTWVVCTMVCAYLCLHMTALHIDDTWYAITHLNLTGYVVLTMNCEGFEKDDRTLHECIVCTAAVDVVQQYHCAVITVKQDMLNKPQLWLCLIALAFENSYDAMKNGSLPRRRAWQCTVDLPKLWGLHDHVSSTHAGYHGSCAIIIIQYRDNIHQLDPYSGSTRPVFRVD